jgi:hypothetical protein
MSVTTSDPTPLTVALVHGAFTDASSWLPSWTIVATDDKAAGADLVRSQAERAGATITEVEGPHVIMISQPEAVADVILTAAATVGQLAATMG